MEKIITKIGEIEYNKGEDFDDDLQVGQESVFFDLQSNVTENKTLMEKVSNFLDNIEENIAKAKKYLNLKSTEEVIVNYLEFHIDELEEDFEAIFGCLEKPSNEKLLEFMRLKRLGVYVDDTDSSKLKYVMDFVLDPIETEYLLVVSFDDTQTPNDINFES